MNKKNKNTHLDQYADSVIRRGYEIYDEWIDQNKVSRKIVASAYDAVKLFKKRKTTASFIEVLAYLFALDTRIKEKYKGILRCLFSYFSWRRETRALGFLKRELNISQGETDIRNLIVVEIERLAEKLADEWEEDGDDETHGGRRNGKADEETETAEKTESEEVAEKEAEKPDDAKEEKEAEEETAEAEAEEATPERSRMEESARGFDGEETFSGVTSEVNAGSVQAGKEEVKQDFQTDPAKDEKAKEEKGGPDERTEPSTGKNQKKDINNGAIDVPPLFEEAAGEKPKAESTSFIDEVIMDNMIKGKGDFKGHTLIEDVRQNHGAEQRQTEEAAGSDKDAHLYDKTVTTDKADAAPSAEKAPTVKTDQPTASEGKAEESRVPLEVDITVDMENEMRKEINYNMSMSTEAVAAFHDRMVEAAREQMKILELEYDTSVEIAGKVEKPQSKQPSIGPSRK